MTSHQCTAATVCCIHTPWCPAMHPQALSCAAPNYMPPAVFVPHEGAATYSTQPPVPSWYSALHSALHTHLLLCSMLSHQRHNCSCVCCTELPCWTQLPDGAHLCTPRHLHMPDPAAPSHVPLETLACSPHLPQCIEGSRIGLVTQHKVHFYCHPTP